jgi:hypothetical protein
MLKPADLDYFRKREEQERMAIADAITIEAREAHSALASHYADRVWALETQTVRQRMRSVRT